MSDNWPSKTMSRKLCGALCGWRKSGASNSENFSLYPGGVSSVETGDVLYVVAFHRTSDSENGAMELTVCVRISVRR